MALGEKQQTSDDTLHTAIHQLKKLRLCEWQGVGVLHEYAGLFDKEKRP